MIMFFFLFFWFVRCTSNSSNQQSSYQGDFYFVEKKTSVQESKDSLDILVQENYIDSVLLLNNLIDVNSVNRDIWFDMKYYSTDNFMHIKLYERINRPFLQKEVADRLSKCQEYLCSIDTSLHLFIYDALRPVSVQWKIWKALDTIPIGEREKYASNPINKSVHNFGAAVDLTICNSKRVPLDMGAGFDEFRKIAYPSMENYFLSQGELTIQQVENRKLLRKVMRSQAFRNLPTEWWHFNACSRADALIKYQVIENEP